MSQHSGSVTLPRGFRYEAPRTPEPLAQNDEAQMASPPKPRLRLKRRVVSQLAAPTQQFLASVAAADVPIPSIEVPDSDSMDSDMLGLSTFHHQSLDEDSTMLLVHPQGRALSPPKTPAPDPVPYLSPKQYPQWSIDSAISSSVESTPDYESSRPSTARSTQTSSSLFSHFSGLSDDDLFLGSEIDCREKYTLAPEEDVELRDNAPTSKRKARKAPWTKPMTDHLWSTFMLYLQDPKVTPVRMGKSGIPPQGVCLRVAREAKRSWKGAKGLAKAPIVTGEGRKSGSSTPTAENSGTFIQWPHTCAATRAHLRELCRLKTASGAKHHRFISKSPTPFTQSAARHWNRRSTPARNPTAFTQDMSMSLALSTSDSMQPQGPLAQLTGSSPEPTEQPHQPALVGQVLSTFEGEPSFAERRRLGSPFSARSYGPSSSGSLAQSLGLTGPMPRRQTHTGPRRRLQSPVRLSRSGTQKRRNTQSSEPRKRPSIGADLWSDPNSTRPETSSGAEFSSTNLNQRDELFIPRTPIEPALTSSASMPDVGAQLAAPDLPPARLGSPFTGSNSAAGTSFSFPNRIHRPYGAGSVDLGSLARPFATIQQYSESSAASQHQQPARGNLAGRLAYIDQRLKELRRRDFRRRSESPL